MTVIIKKSIRHFEYKKHLKTHTQDTYVHINNGKNNITITAIYCSLQGGTDGTQFPEFFQKLGRQVHCRWIP